MSCGAEADVLCSVDVELALEGDLEMGAGTWVASASNKVALLVSEVVLISLRSVELSWVGGVGTITVSISFVRSDSEVLVLSCCCRNVRNSLISWVRSWSVVDETVVGFVGGVEEEVSVIVVKLEGGLCRCADLRCGSVKVSLACL